MAHYEKVEILGYEVPMRVCSECGNGPIDETEDDCGECPVNMDDQDETFPVQGTTIPAERGNLRIPASRIPMSVAKIVYEGYSARYGTSQSLERLGERGGFGWWEVATFYLEGLEIVRKRYEAKVRAR